MVIYPHSPDAPRTHRCATRLACVAATVALAATACGGGSSSTTTAGGAPLSKAAYEQELGPLLNDRVAPAVKALNGNGGIFDPQRLGREITLLQSAHQLMAGLNPPRAVADLHGRAVAALAAIIADVRKLRDAEIRHDTPAEVSAGHALETDGGQLVTVASQFTARGY